MGKASCRVCLKSPSCSQALHHSPRSHVCHRMHTQLLLPRVTTMIQRCTCMHACMLAYGHQTHTVRPDGDVQQNAGSRVYDGNTAGCPDLLAHDQCSREPLGSRLPCGSCLLTLAQTIPSMYSSSFMYATGLPASLTCTAQHGVSTLQLNMMCSARSVPAAHMAACNMQHAMPDSDKPRASTCTDPMIASEVGSMNDSVAEPSLAMRQLPFVVRPQPWLRPTGAELPALMSSRGYRHMTGFCHVS